MKKIAKLIALGTTMAMLLGAGQVWAQKAPERHHGEMRIRQGADDDIIRPFFA